ncbi:MAG: nucleotidyltransferase domain-containing protein [archaeon GB-1867-035]|nr:nucleotidyltransferase domain-containing protein [Candidatus Culexmicrobium profundum]
MWIPRWLGEAYAKLYVEFGCSPFKFRDAMSVLSLNENRVKVILSKLHTKGILTLFDRGRPRIYRLISPENFLLLASGKVRKIEVRQERYVPLIYACYGALSEAVNLASLVLFGSVARGDASKNSDLDLLVISDDFEGSLGRRVEFLVRRVKPRLSGELSLLRRYGYNTFLSFYPLKCIEAKRFPIILLDVIWDGKIVYDKDGFFEKLALEFKSKLMKFGAKRVMMKGGWYWILKDQYEPLEVLPLE